VGLVALELERRGIATVALQLLHKPTAAVLAPRALWVPFWHGYALGAPDQPREQRATVEAALAMLEDAALTAPAWRDFAPPPAQ
jgi:hypothetical protein